MRVQHMRGKGKPALLGMLGVLAVWVGLEASTDSAAGVPTPSGSVTYTGINPPRSLFGQSHAVQELMSTAGDLAENNPDDFLGAYLSATDQVVVVATTQVGKVLAQTQAPGVVIESSNLSINSAAEAGAELSRMLPSFDTSVTFWAAKPQSRSLLVAFNREPTSEERAAMARFALDKEISISVEVLQELSALRPMDNRSVDADPYSGGARSVSSSTTSASDPTNLTRACTTGVGYWRNDQKYLLTAGHCYPSGTNASYMWSVTGASPSYSKVKYMGRATFTSWKAGTGALVVGNDVARHGDLALVNVTTASHSVLPSIWWGTYSTDAKIPVTQRHAPSVGEPLCFSGYVSGSDCGLEVYATNLVSNTNKNGERLDAEDLYYSSAEADCPVAGDSGSPVVYNHNGAETYASLRGIVSQAGSADGECFASGTGIEEAVQAWGGDIQLK